MRRALLVLMLVGVGSMLTGFSAVAADASTSAGPPKTYSDDEIVKQANDFFATGAKGLSDVLAKVLKEKGQPVAFIRGEEAGGAVAVGLRYGHGELVFKDGRHRTVYWQGPSLGFDIGADAVKAFVLVYNLPNAEALFQRFPSVEGSLYFVGGFGVNYVQSDAIALAPVRFGVGWRQGIDVGYMHFSPEKRVNPF
jgi:hypothetical protein